MKITFKKLLEVDTIVASIYKKNPELKEGKFGYGYKRFYEKSYAPNLKKYQDELADIEIDNALEDEKTKAILYNNDKTNYLYSKEGLKKVRQQKDELFEKWNKEEVEIEPYIIKEEHLPELTKEQREELDGIIINNEQKAQEKSNMEEEKVVEAEVESEVTGTDPVETEEVTGTETPEEVE
jgi:hypothetical protein